MTKFIVVDLDLSIAPSDFQWWNYLQEMSSHDDPEPLVYRELRGDLIDYNLGVYFPSLTKEETQSFWSSPTLYDKMKPIPHVVETLAAVEGDVKIVFCSMCRPEHLKSKKNFIDREIGQYLKVPYGFVDTADKDSLKADVFIDDRHNFLNISDNGAVKIKINTPYTQDEELKVPVIAVDTWVEIKGIFKALGYIGEV